MSKTRRAYMTRFVGRCVIFILCLFLCFAAPEQMEVIEEGNFFKRFSLLHLLWVIWVVDMLQQLVPVKRHILALGSQKVFSRRFRVEKGYNRAKLVSYIRSATSRAYQIFAVWAAAMAALSYLYIKGVVDEVVLLMVSVAFYVCDLICVLFWCPFRLFLRNRCCTTCRIFNWDHLMMFTPMLAIDSFFARSLLMLAIISWGVWEVCVLLHPERFWAGANAALQCGNCTDKLCTQYCEKKKAFV